MTIKTHPFDQHHIKRTSARKPKQAATGKISMDMPLAPGRANLKAHEKTVDLVDRKFELTLLKQRIEQELAEVDAELKDGLDEDEAVYGSLGVGYRLVICRQDLYGENAIDELVRMDLLRPFARISTSKLKELVRHGDLPQEKFEALQRTAEVREIPSLREVVLGETE